MKNIIDSVIAYMEEHAHEELRIETIAAHFGYSKYYFAREFKKVTGISPTEYLSSIRIQKGITSITEGESIINSQLDAGHQSAGTFASTFQKNTGLPPKRYKRQMNDLFETSKRMEENTVDSEELFFYHPDLEQAAEDTYQLTIHIEVPDDFKGLLFSGLFFKPNPNHLPAMGRCRVKNFTYIFSQLPAGTYYPLACGIKSSLNPLNYFILDRSLRACDGQQITFPLKKNEVMHLKLRTKLPTDPPITINLPNLLANGIKQQVIRNQQTIKQYFKRAK